MISRWLAASAALAALSFGPSLAMASDADVARQLQDMQQRMQQMEDKLQATNDQLDSANQRVEEQSQLIEDAGLAETRGSSNGLPGFLGEITVGGWVAASYLYNINDPNDASRDGLQDTNTGLNGRYYPFHPDHNSFSLDQVWWEIERPIDEEHRGGFRFDTAYGKTAAMLGGPNNRDNRDDSAFYISQGYVQYLAPLGDGVTFKMGKFNTPIGAEVAQTVYNWQITRGALYTLLQPIDHIGITAGYTFGDSGFDAMIGGVNGFLPDDPDRNDAKSILGNVGWANDSVSVDVSGIWGGENTGFDGGETGLVDAVVKLKASDRLAFWINGDYAWLDDSDNAAWGVAAAGRFGITDRTGISLRGEYVADVDEYLGFVGITGDNGGLGFDTLADTGIDTWGITATVDHLLTDHLMIRAEARYDNINKDDTDNDEFWENSDDIQEDQIVIGAEVIYNFNKFGGE